jgi:hypothetical protein
LAYLPYSPVTVPAPSFILTLTLLSKGALLPDHIAERSSLSLLGPQQRWAKAVPVEGLEPKPRPLVIGVGEPVGAGLVLSGGQPLSRDACSSPHNVPYPAPPRVKRPSTRFALRSGEGHRACGSRSFWAFSGRRWTSNAANYTSQRFRSYRGKTLEPLLWCLGLYIFRQSYDSPAFALSSGALPTWPEPTPTSIRNRLRRLPRPSHFHSCVS